MGALTKRALTNSCALLSAAQPQCRVCPDLGSLHPLVPGSPPSVTMALLQSVSRSLMALTTAGRLSALLSSSTNLLQGQHTPSTPNSTYIVRGLITCLDSNSARDLAKKNWYVASKGQQNDSKQLEQLVQLVAAFVSAASSPTSQGIGSSLWAAGKLGLKVTRQGRNKLLAAFTAEGVLARATPLDISNTLWGVALLGHHTDSEQLQRILAAFTSDSMLARATPQDISNALWGLALLGHHTDSEQLQRMVAAFTAEHMLAAATPYDMSHALCALAQLGWQVNNKQLQLIRTAFVSKLDSATPQELFSTGWALGRLCGAGEQP